MIFKLFSFIFLGIFKTFLEKFWTNYFFSRQRVIAKTTSTLKEELIPHILNQVATASFDKAEAVELVYCYIRTT